MQSIKVELVQDLPKNYNAFELLYYEIHNELIQAIAREKQLKEWKRSWKIELIQTMNPEMVDLASDWEYELEVDVSWQ